MACICLYMRQKYKLEWVARFMNTDQINDPSKISFMYDELINDIDQCDDVKRRGKTFDLAFIIQLCVLMIGPIPGFDLYIQVRCQNDTMIYY